MIYSLGLKDKSNLNFQQALIAGCSVYAKTHQNRISNLCQMLLGLWQDDVTTHAHMPHPLTACR